VPDGLGIAEAAVLLHDGRTAVSLIDQAHLLVEEWVLILGAAGGLGSLLVQLAHGAGTRVIGAARGSQKHDLAQELGADAVVDYSQSSWPEQVLTVTGGVGPSMVFDGVGGEIGRSAFEITARGGQFSGHGAPSGGFAQIDREDAERRDINRARDRRRAVRTGAGQAAHRASHVDGCGAADQAGHRTDVPVGAGR
jgi:NADPH2:quinone reductase